MTRGREHPADRGGSQQAESVFAWRAGNSREDQENPVFYQRRSVRWVKRGANREPD